MTARRDRLDEDARAAALAAVTGHLHGMTTHPAALAGLLEQIEHGETAGHLIAQLVILAALAVEGWSAASGHDVPTLLDALRFG